MFFREKPPQGMTSIFIGKAKEEAEDEARAAFLLKQDKENRQKEARHIVLEGDLLELLGPIESMQWDEPLNPDGFFGIDRWLVEPKVTLRSYFRRLLENKINEHMAGKKKCSPNR